MSQVEAVGLKVETLLVCLRAHEGIVQREAIAAFANEPNFDNEANTLSSYAAACS